MDPLRYSICDEYSPLPEVLSIAEQAFLAVSVPINLLGILCILLASKSHLHQMRWVFLNHQIWMILFDVTISGLLTPKYLVPIVAMYPRGLFSIVRLPAVVVVILGIITSSGMICSLAHIFFQRYQSILPQDHPRRLTPGLKNIVIIILYLSMGPLIVYFISVVPLDSYSIKDAVARTQPCIPRELFASETIVFSVEDGPMAMVIISLTCLFIFGFSAFSIAESFIALKRTRSTVSNNAFHTKQALLNALIILLIQSTVSLFLLIVPVVICVYLTLNKERNESLAAICAFFVTLHSTCGTTVMLMLNRAYRKFIIQSFQKLGRKFRGGTTHSMISAI